MKMHCHKRFILSLTLLLCFGAALFSESWNVNQNGNWNVSTNWTPATVPNSSGATATFPNLVSQATTVSVNGTFSVGTLTFESFNPYTLTGGTLDLFSAVIVNAPNGSHIINTNLALQGNVTITNSTTSPLTISGVVSGANQLIVAQGSVVVSGKNIYSNGTTISSGNLQGTATSIQGNVTNNATLTFNEPASGTYGGSISGTGNVVLAGGGTVIFTGNNTYSGGTQFNAGILQISNINQVGTGTFTFNGGTLQATATLSNNRAITLTGNGTIQTASGVTFTQSGANITGAGTLIKVGNGVLDLGTTSNTYTGGTQINGGILQINNAGNIGSTGQISMNGGNLNSTATFSLGNTFVLNGNSIIGANAGTTLTLTGTLNGKGAFIKAGPGIVSLDVSPNSNSYSGGTQINSGVLRVGAPGNLGSGLITFNGATLHSTANIAENNNVQLNPTNGIFDTDGGTTFTVGGKIGGPGTLIKQGNGTLDLGLHRHTYLGGTQINAGILQINANGNLGHHQVAFNGGTLSSTGNIVVDLEAALNATGIFNTAAGTTLTWNGPITMGGSLTKTGNGTLVLRGSNNYSGGTLISGGFLEGTTTSIQGNVTNNATLTFKQSFDGSYGSVITGSGNVAKTGTGTVALTNANGYTGETQFNEGTLQINAINQLGTGLRRFNGGALRTTATLSDGINILLDGKGTFNTDTGTTLTLNGMINPSPGMLIKTGGGTLDLGPNAHSYSGGTQIEQGILRINVNGNLGTGNISFHGGTLQNTANVTLSQGGTINTIGTIDTATGTLLNWTGSINGLGRLVKTGAGTLGLTGTNSYSGGTNLLQGMIVGTTEGIQGDILNNGVLNFDQGIAGVYAGSISGSGSVQINGGGTVTFRGSNSYSGGTQINSGTLIGTTNSLQGEIANNGTLNFNQNFNGTFHGTLTGPGALIKSESGTTFFTGDYPLFTGLTTINGGTLNLSGAFNGDVTVNSGGTFAGTNQINNLTNLGTVSVGNGIGEILVNGLYTQSSTGNLMIEVDSFGNRDLLGITGNANLAGALNVTLLPGVYSGSEVYTIITAATVNPGFSSVSSSIGAPLSVNYLTSSVQIGVSYRGSILPVPINVLSPNAKHIAEYLFCPGFFPNNPDLLNVMRSLVTLPPNEFVKNLDQFGPALFGALPLTELQNNHLIADTIVTNAEKAYWCEDCAHREKCASQNTTFSVWMMPVGQWQTQKGYEEQIGFTTRSYGLGLGATYLFAPWIQLGGGIGYLYTDLGWKQNGGKGNWNSLYVGPSLGLINKNWYFNILALGSFNFYSIDRKVSFPGFNRTAHNHHYSFGFLGRIEGGYKITFVTLENDFPLSFIPTVRLSYLNLFEEGYRETGAGSINLDVNRKYTAFLQPECLIKVLREIYFSQYCFIPSFQIGWVGNIPVSSTTYTSSFVGDEPFCKSEFSVQSFNKTTNQLSFGLDFILKKMNHYEIGIGYEGRAFDDLYVNSAKIHVDWKF